VDVVGTIQGAANDGDAVAQAMLVGLGNNNNWSTTAAAAFLLESAVVANPANFKILDGRTWLQLQSAGGGGRSLLRVRGFNQPTHRLDWRDTIGTVQGALATDPSALAYVWQAWLRKTAAGDATHSQQSFGFEDVTNLNPSATIPRAGLIGDGVLGFKYGSVNTPDGAAAGENGAADIAAGAVYAAGMDAPGAAMWHTAIKIVPPLSATQPGRWGAYHNFQLVKVFDQVANFPRGSAAVNRNFSRLECMAYVGKVAFNLCMARWRFTITSDTSLDAALAF
jgi:hypothetical protein